MGELGQFAPTGRDAHDAARQTNGFLRALSRKCCPAPPVPWWWISFAIVMGTVAFSLVAVWALSALGLFG